MWQNYLIFYILIFFRVFMICKFPAWGYRQNYKLGPKIDRFITFSVPDAFFSRRKEHKVFKCLFDLFVPHSYMKLQKIFDLFIILIFPYRIPEHAPIEPERSLPVLSVKSCWGIDLEANFDIENIYWHFRLIIISYWTVLLVILTCLSEGACQSQALTTLLLYWVCLRWS